MDGGFVLGTLSWRETSRVKYHILHPFTNSDRCVRMLHQRLAHNATGQRQLGQRHADIEVL